MSQELKPPPTELLNFEYRHPKNGDSYTVSVTREEVSHHMCEVLFEKLCAEFCECEPVGESNFVDCRCDEYADEFERVQLAAPVPTADHFEDVRDMVVAAADPVQRFWAEEARNIRCVRESDFDAHVTRLQAEINLLNLDLKLCEQEKQKFIEANESLGNLAFEKVALQSELTKARESANEAELLLSAIRDEVNLLRDTRIRGEHVLVLDRIAAKAEECLTLLAHQPALAAKGEGDE